MGQKIPPAIKERVIIDWLQAKPRNTIADELDISYGSVTNIIDEAKRDSIRDIDLLREVAVLLKKNNLDLTQFAMSIKLKNKLDNLKINEIQADSFLENAVIHCFRVEVDPHEFFYQISQVCSVCEYHNIPLYELALFIENAKEKGDQNK